MRTGGAQGIRRASLRDLDQLAALWRAINAHHSDLDPLFTERPDGYLSNLTTLVYINEVGLIAGSAGATRTYFTSQSNGLTSADSSNAALNSAPPDDWPLGSQNNPFGTPTVWYPTNVSPFYEALPIVVGLQGTNTTAPAPVAAVTGLGDDSNSTTQSRRLRGPAAADGSSGRWRTMK